LENGIDVMTTKSAIFIASTAIGILLGCQTPDALRYDHWNPAIHTYELELKKSTFFADTEMKDVTDLKYIRSESERHIRITGRAKSILLDADGSDIEHINFPGKNGRMMYVGKFPSSPIRYIDRGGGWQPVAVFDREGAPLWRHGPAGSAPNSLAAGDMDGDGEPEIIVVYNGSGGIARLDRNGEPVSMGSGKNLWHVELIDSDGDGVEEIVHSDVKGRLIVRSHDLSVLKVIDSDYYIHDFTPVIWPVTATNASVLFRDRDTFVIMDFNGSILFTSKEVNGHPWSSDIKAVWVHFEGEEFPHLAVMEGIRATWKRARLSIFSSSGILTYQEVIEGVIPALATIPANGNMREQRLLVGGPGTVWMYRH